MQYEGKGERLGRVFSGLRSWRKCAIGEIDPIAQVRSEDAQLQAYEMRRCACC